jgi:hypothetical protein
MAQTAGYIPGVPAEKRRQFQDYSFGHQDPYRLIMQNDVDALPIPSPHLPVILRMVMQFPYVECAECDEDLGLLTYLGWNMEVHPMN